MHSIPYGTVLKMRELGLVEKEARVSGRTVPHLSAGGQEWAVIDNGFVNGKHWRFLKGAYLTDFNFSEADLPIILLITDVKVELVNKRNERLRCSSIEEGTLVVSVLRSFYPGNYSSIRVEDSRREIALAKAQTKLDQLTYKKEEVDKQLAEVTVEVQKLAAQVSELEAEAD